RRHRRCLRPRGAGRGGHRPPGATRRLRAGDVHRRGRVLPPAPGAAGPAGIRRRGRLVLARSPPGRRDARSGPGRQRRARRPPGL
ncbi:MAG: 4-hydroxy-3-methylbut-2-enyl diphosphate reductase, partial [uncultured Acidimicrobiales bacterium]